MDQFPGNSQRARGDRREPTNPPAEPKKIERIVSGEVIRRKKPLGKRVREMFLGGDGPTVWQYAVEDIIVPGMRDIFVDMTIGSVERMVYGQSRSSYRRPRQHIGGPGAPINYNGFASRPVGGRMMRDEPRVPTLSHRARAALDFDEIIIDSRSEAEMILDGLYHYLEQYEQVAVSDLYEMLGISANFTEQRWGWTDLAGSRIERVRNGYLLNLPRPELLER